MKNFLLITSFFLFVPCGLKSSVPVAPPQQTGTFRSHNQMIEMYKEECSKYPSVTSFHPIGKTTQNNDIWAFKIGNPKGGKIIIDGCLHGWEDLGSELTFIWIKWLLESNSPAAKKILKRTCWMVIPVIDFDTYERGNMNQNVCSGGVDLNRNFIHDWVFVPECKGPFGTSHGASAGSEKETQVMRTFMEANRPMGKRKSVYINTHYGGGPWIHYNGNNEAGFYDPLRSKLIDLWSKNNIQLRNITIEKFLPPSASKASPGGAASDAADYGYDSFTLEVLARSCIDGHKFGPIDAPCGERRGGANHPSYELVQTALYPIFEQFFLSVSESVGR